MPSLRKLLALFAVALVATLPLLQHHSAFAHPLGNFTVNRYARVEVYRDAIQVHYALDIAEIPTFQLVQDIGDSQTAIDAWAAKTRDSLGKNLSLSVGDQRLDLVPLDAEAHLLPGQGGLQVTRLDAAFEAMLPAGIQGRTPISLADANEPDKPGWREIVVRGSDGAVLSIDPSLTVDRSDGLRSYPTQSLQSAPNIRQVSFAWTAGTGAAAPQSVRLSPSSAGRASSGFAGLLHHDRSLGFILLSLLAAFGFGALHALGPGHGKTVVAAYLVGSKGTARHAVALGLTVTATHTSTVYLLGFITLTASAYIVPETLYLWLGIGSGAMVVAMGLFLFSARLWRFRHPATNGAHRHGLFARAHSHEPAAQREHEHEHDHLSAPIHGPSAPAAAAAAAVANDTPRVGWRSLLTLGVAGGLLPCPSAIVVMLAAISLGQVFFGMLLIVAFSLGLAGVLTGIGIALVWGKRLSRRFSAARRLQQPAFARAIAALPVLSALGIAIAGAAITYQAWNQPL